MAVVRPNTGAAYILEDFVDSQRAAEFERQSTPLRMAFHLEWYHRFRRTILNVRPMNS